MELKKDLKNSTDDFWYDLTMGGYLKPENMCADLEDAKRVREAINVVREFERACTDQIEGFER